MPDAHSFTLSVCAASEHPPPTHASSQSVLPILPSPLSKTKPSGLTLSVHAASEPDRQQHEKNAHQSGDDAKHHQTDRELHSWGAAHGPLWDALRKKGRQVRVIGIAVENATVDRAARVLEKWAAMEPGTTDEERTNPMSTTNPVRGVRHTP